MGESVQAVVTSRVKDFLLGGTMWFTKANSNTSYVAEEQNSDLYDILGSSVGTQVGSSYSTQTSFSEFSTQQSVPLDRPLRLEAKIKRVWDMEADQFLTTGCSDIDRLLKGGIPCFGITEIYGESRAAKTQFCLQLSLIAQLPIELGGLASGAVYINTENVVFPAKRMVELSEHFCAKFGICSQEDPMDNVIIETALDNDSLYACLSHKIPAIINDRRIRLIVLDSIGAIYRGDYSSEDFEERTSDLRRVGKLLHELSRSLKAAVVVVNQVASNLTSGNNVPALGPAWTNMVTTRLHLIRLENNRFIEVKHAPHIRPGSLKINLSAAGIASDISTRTTPTPTKKPKNS